MKTVCTLHWVLLSKLYVNEKDYYRGTYFGSSYQYKNVYPYKKGLDARLSAYLSLIFYYFRDLEDEEIRRVINGWLDEWFKVRKRE